MAAAAIASALSCPTCQGVVDVKTRHVVVSSAGVRLFCSERCLATRDLPPEPLAVEQAPPRRRSRVMWWLTGGIVIGATVSVAQVRRTVVPAATPPVPVIETATDIEAHEAPPPDEKQSDVPEIDLEEITHDAWIHPLAGPTRRMPVNHNGAFGAARDGERPPECVSGHCGVDVGKDWGEPVHAAHDGVVDWVDRGPNEEHGGIFVRISHRGGTLFTWYFHLAAVPRSIKPGVEVKMGQVIGLLGDTGIKHSAPHLHFALSVKTGPHSERYLDPEPLIAIWPLWIANDNGGRVTTVAAPGIPVRADRPRAPASAPSPTPAPAPETTGSDAPAP